MHASRKALPAWDTFLSFAGESKNSWRLVSTSIPSISRDELPAKLDLDGWRAIPSPLKTVENSSSALLASSMVAGWPALLLRGAPGISSK
jgi:hypothetical protein